MGMKRLDIAARINLIFRSLRYRNYRLFFGGQSISLIGTWMQRIALPWMVYRMTGSAFMLGLVGFVGQIPTFILAPVAGVVTDRFHRYRVLIITQIVSMAQASVLAYLTLSGDIKLWHIIVLSIILGCVTAFDVPSRHSFVVDMVEKKEDLGNAIALNSMMFNGARLIGPSIAGVILAVTSEGICFLLNAISFIFVIASLLMMKVDGKKKSATKSGLFSDLKEGFLYAFGFAPIKHIILLLALVSLMGTSYQVLMPVYAKEVLKGGSEIFGFLMGAAGLGAFLAALYLASRETVITLGRIIPLATGIAGAALTIISLEDLFFLTFFLMVFVGLGLMLHTVSSNTILQTITDDDKRGRIMSFYTMSIMGIAPFGSLIAGAMAKALGTRLTLLIGGISCLAGAYFFYRKLPLLKKIARPKYEKMGMIPEIVTGIQIASEPDLKTEE